MLVQCQLCDHFWALKWKGLKKCAASIGAYYQVPRAADIFYHSSSFRCYNNNYNLWVPHSVFPRSAVKGNQYLSLAYHWFSVTSSFVSEVPSKLVSFWQCVNNKACSKIISDDLKLSCFSLEQVYLVCSMAGYALERRNERENILQGKRMCSSERGTEWHSDHPGYTY